MKRSMLVLILLFVILFQSSAEKVTKAEAQGASQAFLQHQQMTTGRLSKSVAQASIRTSKTLLSVAGEELGCVFELTPTGFIVTSLDTDVEPVIAYSFNSTFSFADVEHNALLQLLRTDLQQRLASLAAMDKMVLKKNNEKWKEYLSGANSLMKGTEVEQWPPPGSTTTGGWIMTTWVQDSPYNTLCPMDPITNKRSIVGCVSTALSQILHFHKYIGDCLFSSSDRYATMRGIKIDADSAVCDFPSLQRLNSMLAPLKAKYRGSQNLTTEEISVLNFAVGVALLMDYTSSASSAYLEPAEHALLKKFDYRASLLAIEGPTFYETLKSNMMNALPAILVTCTHAFVCDGYTTNGFYHLNYGWGGASPDSIQLAWYSLPRVPGGVVGRGVLNIMPNSNLFSIDPGYLNFGRVKMNAESAARSFTLRNSTSSTVVVDSISSGAHFLMSSGAATFSRSLRNLQIGPNSSQSVYVKFVPAVAKECYAVLSVTRQGQPMLKYAIVEGIGASDTVSITSAVALTKGWNMISLCAQPSDCSVESILASIKSSIVMVKDGKGGIYWPQFNTNTIGTWNLTQGYQVRVNQDVVLQSTGRLVDPQTTSIELLTGWNLIAYPKSVASPIATELVSVGANLVMVKNNFGQVYWPAYNFNTIGSMEPGQGYVLYAKANTSFHYPLNSVSAEEPVLLAASPDPGNPPPVGRTVASDVNSILLVRGQFLQDGDGIVVRTEDGTNVGQGSVLSHRALVTVWGDASTSEEKVVGMKKLTITLVRSGNTGSEPLNVEKTTDALSGQTVNELVFMPNKAWIADVKPPEVLQSGDVPTEPMLFQNYPNPFNPTTSIHYYVPTDGAVSLTVYDVQGKMVAIIVDAHQKAGFHKSVFDGATWPSGTYFCTLRSQSFSITRKMILTK